MSTTCGASAPRWRSRGSVPSCPRRAEPVARELSAAVARFATLLRRSGLPVTLVEVTDAVRALDPVAMAARHGLYAGLRAVFARLPEEFPVFDRCFEAFGRAAIQADYDSESIPMPSLDEQDGASLAGGQKREALALESWGDGEEESESGDPLSVPLASESETLIAQDFSTFSADQLDELLKLTIKIARRLAHRISRRRKPVRRRGRVDLRRTLRANLTKGDLIDLRFRQRKRKKIRLVLLCDVSGSMDLYSRFLLQFLFALQHVFGRVETFTLSTRLKRINVYLSRRSYRQVLRRLTDVRDWSGGTRIDESLAQLNRQWPHLVGRRATVRRASAWRGP